MNLKKKVGPMPMWAWVLIVGTALGLLWYEHSKGATGSSSSTSSTNAANQIDPATGMTYAEEAGYQSQGIDPLTGQTYASEYSGGGYGASSYGGGTGLTDTGTSTGAAASYPDLATEIADVTSAVSGLQSLGLFAPAPAADAGATQTAGPASTATKSTKQKFTDTLKGGTKITNFKPRATKTTTVKGIGHGLYQTTVKHTATTTKTKTSGGKKRTITSGRNRAGGLRR